MVAQLARVCPSCPCVAPLHTPPWLGQAPTHNLGVAHMWIVRQTRLNEPLAAGLQRLQFHVSWLYARPPPARGAVAAKTASQSKFVQKERWARRKSSPKQPDHNYSG